MEYKVYNNVVLFFIWQKREIEGCIIAINGIWLCSFLYVSFIIREATRFDFPYASITDDIRKYALQEDLPSTEEITGNLGSPGFFCQNFYHLDFQVYIIYIHRHNEKFIFFLKLLRVEIFCQCTYMYTVLVITLSVDSPWAWSDQFKFQ